MAMKSTGIVRKVDELGRLVIPKEIRDGLKIGHNDPLEIYMEGDKIIVTLYQPSCIFCGSEENLVEMGEKKVCAACVEALKSKVE